MGNADFKPMTIKRQDKRRGSEWRKWDLHIHSPASFFWTEGKLLSRMSEAEKEVSIKKFIETVNSSDVAVFAIQDYWTFDWIFELRKYVQTHPESLKKTVLPGIELRIECPTDYRLNIHAVISDSVTDQKLKDFRSELKIRNGTQQKNVSEEALIEFAKSLDGSKAKVHGYGNPTTLNDEKLLELGSKTIEITKDSLTKAFEHLPAGSGFVLLPYDTSDGLLKLDWKKHPQDDNYFMQTANIFESRDQRNIDLFNGIKTEDNKEFFDNFFKTIGSTPKPCVAGSDAHKFSDYGKYPSSKATWIKADPTFEGLKQIIYEPNDRVKIQELNPEEKPLHLLIDRIEYKDNKNNQKIVYLNQNLNSVIGSRAQGKSNLLKNIAYSVDPEQCKLRGVSTDDFYPFKSFKVIWSDGKESLLNGVEEKEKGILFIPQGYLGELVYGKDPRFDNFLVNLFENREDFQKATNDYRKFEDANILLITSLIREILAIRSSGLDRQDKLKKLGKKEDLEKDIKVTEERITKFGKTASVTLAELKSHETLSSEKSKKEKQVRLIEQDVESFKKLKDEEVISSDRIFELEFSKSSVDKIKKKLAESDMVFKKDFIDGEIVSLSKIKTNITKEIEKLEKDIKPLQDKVNKSRALVELTDSLGKKKEVKVQIEALDKELKDLKKEYENKKVDIIKQYLSFGDEFKNLKVDFGTLNFSQVKIIIAFDVDSFIRTADENINYHNSTNFRKDDKGRYKEAIGFFNSPAEWVYDKKKFTILLKEVLDGILSNQLILKTGKDVEGVLVELFKNRYKIDFLQSIMSKKGVVFLDMSDGEQMLALLEFIFKFDDYNYPVILDQPEDDLDSRAISTTIVNFVKSEKVKRQIIIASHNANLVVCGDSESVILSEKSGRNNPDFSYSCGAVEDETINKEIVEILEGGKEALRKRMKKLNVER